MESEEAFRTGQSKLSPGKEVNSSEKSTIGKKVVEKMKNIRRQSLSLRESRSIETELDEEEPKLKSKSSRGRRSLDLDLNREKPKLKNKPLRGRFSIDVELDEGKGKESKSSSRGRSCIEMELNGVKGKESKSSCRERRSIDMDLNGGKVKKSKSSRRKRHTIDVESTEGKVKKSKSSRRKSHAIDVQSIEGKAKKSTSSRRERRALSIDMDFASDNRKEKCKSSATRRTLSVDSGDSVNLECEQPKGTKSLAIERNGGAAKTPARKRARSRKKGSPKRKSKSPTRKKPSKSDHYVDEGNETSLSNSLDTGDVYIDEPVETKPHPSSPSRLLNKLKGLREERTSRKDAGRSHSPNRLPKPSKISRKLRLSIT